MHNDLWYTTPNTIPCREKLHEKNIDVKSSHRNSKISTEVVELSVEDLVRHSQSTKLLLYSTG